MGRPCPCRSTHWPWLSPRSWPFAYRRKPGGWISPPEPQPLIAELADERGTCIMVMMIHHARQHVPRSSANSAIRLLVVVVVMAIGGESAVAQSTVRSGRWGELAAGWGSLACEVCGKN